MQKKTIEKKKVRKSTITKSLTKREVQERFENAHFHTQHPDRLYETIGELIIKSQNGETTAEEDDTILTGGYLNTFDRNHIFLAESLSGELQIGVVEMTNNLIQEYNCNTTLEKTLCEVIALNYGKTMQISRKFTGTMNAGEYLSDKRTRYLSMLSKELDRANRAYLMSLNNLIEVKRPQISVNIRTKNAYISENQQINNNLKIDEKNIKT